MKNANDSTKPSDPEQALHPRRPPLLPPRNRPLRLDPQCPAQSENQSHRRRRLSTPVETAGGPEGKTADRQIACRRCAGGPSRTERLMTPYGHRCRPASAFSIKAFPLCPAPSLDHSLGSLRLAHGVEAADWSLTPGRYVDVAPQEVDEDFEFEQAITDIHTELAELNKEAVELAKTIQRNFEELGV